MCKANMKKTIEGRNKWYNGSTTALLVVAPKPLLMTLIMFPKIRYRNGISI